MDSTPNVETFAGARRFADEETRIPLALNSVSLLDIAGQILTAGSLLCYVTVVVQMFMHGESGWGVAGILLLFCCPLVVFVYGWAKVNEWDNVLLMSAWTCCILMSIAVGVASVAIGHSA